MSNAVTTTNGRMVQCGLFAQLPASETLYPALKPTDSYKKKTTGKGKSRKSSFVLTDGGQKIVTATKITILPAKSKDKASLEKTTGFTGQALMEFERKARKEALDTFFAEFTKLAMNGDNTFDMMRYQANGKVQFGLRPVNGMSGFTFEQLKAKAEALGFTLVKLPEAAKAIEVGATTEQAPTPEKPKRAPKAVTPQPVPQAAS